MEVKCPTCGRRFQWNEQARSRPFCSERCRLIDLGEWLDEGYRIPDRNPARPFDPPDETSGN
ncbi:MAG TPA: DNA gyrase inhibitor YacG [Sedimenticola thiotaurini]|uniref:DNA gyrase inhibitor YacG n=1 Tax=Sedimenticola thiotaurini TaxID=1543721 RepID=A0A831RKD9_9GAMM|nr:DNA gyrase inhibitor YacG [Sedimenticola thiotaurini]